MKKLMLLLATFAFIFVSCSRDELIPDFTESEQVEDVRTKNPAATSNSDDDGWDDNKNNPNWKDYQLPDYGQGASPAKGTSGYSRWPTPSSSKNSEPAQNNTGEEYSPKQTAPITIRLTATTGGYVIGSGNYNVGANVHCKAIANDGYRFVRWSGVLSGYDSDIYIDANISFSSQAIFSKK